MPNEDMLEVTVTDFLPFAPTDTVIVFRGITNDDNSDSIRFAVDHSPATALIEALHAGEGPTVWLEKWQILFNERVMDEARAKGQLSKGLSDARARTAVTIQNYALLLHEHEQAIQNVPQPENMFEIAQNRRFAEGEMHKAIEGEMQAVLRAREGGLI